MSLTWNGEAHKKKLMKAARRGIDKTMKEAVASAKGDHPGWESRSGKAEKSIAIVERAKVTGKAEVSGAWGSRGVFYMRFLEHLKGSALRNAGDATYSNLKRHIRDGLK